MKNLLLIILTLIALSCTHKDDCIDKVYTSQYMIFNKSSHNIDLLEVSNKNDSILNKYHLSVNDSLTITTPNKDHTVSLWGYGDLYVLFDDSIKYNCVTHDFHFCWASSLYKHRSATNDLIVLTYDITDDDYNKIVSILSEEQ